MTTYRGFEPPPPTTAWMKPTPRFFDTFKDLETGKWGIVWRDVAPSLLGQRNPDQDSFDTEDEAVSEVRKYLAGQRPPPRTR